MAHSVYIVRGCYGSKPITLVTLQYGDALLFIKKVAQTRALQIINQTILTGEGKPTGYYIETHILGIPLKRFK